MGGVGPDNGSYRRGRMALWTDGKYEAYQLSNLYVLGGSDRIVRRRKCERMPKRVRAKA